MDIKDKNLPRFPFGAVYYRVSNPPREDWERDYRTAAEDGNNLFRHWFLWSAIERSPGVYTWDDYDRQLELAAENDMKTIIAEHCTVAPEWMRKAFPHARWEEADGRRAAAIMHGSCATGGIAMCLDDPDVRAKAEEFLVRLVTRYREHPGLGGYDIWNECNHTMCYCPATQARFRRWLQKKYGTIERLRQAWYRPGISDWEDIEAPRILLPYNETMDWLKFHVDKGHEDMQWRADIIRALDPDHRVTAHGKAKTLHTLPTVGTDDWRAADIVDSYGLTWGSQRHGDEPWKQCEAMDLVRCAARGKPVWHAECYGGPLWLQPQVEGKRRSEGRIPTPEDIRYWNLTSYMHGMTGSLYLRWRPLLDGPLFGAFGPYGMDGSRTDRSEMSTAIGKWAQAPEQASMWESRPVKGDIGILFVPEAELFTYALRKTTAPYGDSYDGAYIGFYENNIQADFVDLQDMDDYDTLYLPYPVMLESKTAEALKRWVANGGTLICEGCPAYWGDETHVGRVQPNLGLDQLFGCREDYVEFTPDLLRDLTMTVLGQQVWGGEYMQAYRLTTGKAAGWYEDGRIAAVEHTYGRGKTLLLGSMAGWGMRAHPDGGRAGFFKKLLTFAGKEQGVTVSNPRVRVRHHSGPGGDYLWLANPGKEGALTVSVRLPGRRILSNTARRGDPGQVANGALEITVPARDVSVVRITLE